MAEVRGHLDIEICSPGHLCELGQVGSRFSGEQQCPGELLNIGAREQKGEEQWEEPWPPACLGREQAEGEGGGCCCGEW